MLFAEVDGPTEGTPKKIVRLDHNLNGMKEEKNGTMRSHQQ